MHAFDCIQSGSGAAQPRRTRRLAEEARFQEAQPTRGKCEALSRKVKRPPEGPLHSPSRFRFRPPNPLTFGFRLRPSSGASTYLRPVLGAIGTLGPRESRCKVTQWEQRAFCELFFFQHFPSISSNLWKSLVCSGLLSTPAANGGLSEAEQAAFPPRCSPGFSTTSSNGVESQRRSLKRQNGASTGSVTRSTRRARRSTTGRATRETSSAHPSPTSTPAMTSSG